MLHDLPLDAPGWDWGDVRPIPTEHLGRRCLTFADVEGRVAAVSDVQLTDGAIEIDMASSPEEVRAAACEAIAVASPRAAS